MKRRLAALVAISLVTGGCDASPAPSKTRPDLYLITSLPLMFGEGFDVGFTKPPVTNLLEQDFALKPVDLPSQVPAGARLLMAQPRALPAEELVALDKWVRAGGKLVLLADPMLEWPSERPIGDRLRPPLSFADTGLLQHWGLRLDAPDPVSPHRPLSSREIEVGHYRVVADGPGTLVSLGPGPCRIEAQGFLARCVIGQGRTAIVADADVLNVGDGKIARGKRDNMRWLRALLGQVESFR